METKLRTEIENKLQDEKLLYRPGRQIRYHIHTITEKQLYQYIACLYLESAFDNIPRKYTREALDELKVTEKLRKIVKSLNTKCRVVVKLNGQTSEEYNIEVGIAGR